MGSRYFQFQKHYNFTGADFNRDVMQTLVSHPLELLHSILDDLIFYIIKIHNFIIIGSPGATFQSMFLQLQEITTTTTYV